MKYKYKIKLCSTSKFFWYVCGLHILLVASIKLQKWINKISAGLLVYNFVPCLLSVGLLAM